MQLGTSGFAAFAAFVYSRTPYSLQNPIEYVAYTDFLGFDYMEMWDGIMGPFVEENGAVDVEGTSRFKNMALAMGKKVHTMLSDFPPAGRLMGLSSNNEVPSEKLVGGLGYIVDREGISQADVDRTIVAFKQHMLSASQLGVKAIRLNAFSQYEGANAGLVTAENRLQLAAEFRSAAKDAFVELALYGKSIDMIVLIENHINTLISTGDDWKLIIDSIWTHLGETDKKWCQFLPDPNNWGAVIDPNTGDKTASLSIADMYQSYEALIPYSYALCIKTFAPVAVPGSTDTAPGAQDGATEFWDWAPLFHKFMTSTNPYKSPFMSFEPEGAYPVAVTTNAALLSSLNDVNHPVYVSHRGKVIKQGNEMISATEYIQRIINAEYAKL
jgi:hypothetical protein